MISQKFEDLSCKIIQTDCCLSRSFPSIRDGKGWFQCNSDSGVKQRARRDWSLRIWNWGVTSRVEAMEEAWSQRLEQSMTTKSTRQNRHEAQSTWWGAKENDLWSGWAIYLSWMFFFFLFFLYSFLIKT